MITSVLMPRLGCHMTVSWFIHSCLKWWKIIISGLLAGRVDSCLAPRHLLLCTYVLARVGLFACERKWTLVWKFCSQLRKIEDSSWTVIACGHLSCIVLQATWYQGQNTIIVAITYYGQLDKCQWNINYYVLLDWNLRKRIILDNSLGHI